MVTNLRLIYVGLIFIEIVWGFDSNEELIQYLKESGAIRSKQVEKIMLSVDRGLFVDHNPYVDSAQLIGFGVTISSPHMHAVALEQILPKLVPGARILDVGSGSGYLTVCFAKMMGSKGLSLGIDHIKELVEQSVINSKKVPGMEKLLETGNLIFKIADGRNGFPPLAPFDAIHVGAGSETIPKKLVEQLKIGGILICPIGKAENQYLNVVTRLSNDTIDIKQLMKVIYVPLTDKPAQLLQQPIFKI